VETKVRFGATNGECEVAWPFVFINTGGSPPWQAPGRVCNPPRAVVWYLVYR